LVYAHDRACGQKHLWARQLVESLWESGNGVLSTQVLQEFCINVRCKAAQPMQLEDLRQLIREYSTWEVVVNTAESVVSALEIEIRYKTSFGDALILQAAESAGATTVYSEDLASGQKYGTLLVVNPLVEGFLIR
jgi:predicted nucleic acid-binding protein